jgi:hypothetical protein
MKNSRFCIFLLLLIFAVSVSAQDSSRLKELTDDLKKQSDDLVDATSKNLKKRSSNSQDDLEQAFLAEQLQTSSKLMERLIDNKRGAEELRFSGRILSNLVRRSPRFNSNQVKWQAAVNTIDILNRELRLFTGEEKNVEEDKEEENRMIVGRVFWRGQVDAEVQLVVRDLEFKVNTISGQTYPPGTHSFTSRLARDNRLTVGVKKEEGRGRVRVIQQPSVENNYTTIVQIYDGDGGADEYLLEVFWERPGN